MGKETICWIFYGYETPAGGRVVQERYDGLSVVEREEIEDVLLYHQALPRTSWSLPTFEAFDPDISEFKIKVGVLNRFYRIYGTFWPIGKRYSHTFLLGKYKKQKKDRQGEQPARQRLRELRGGNANTHEFEFQEGHHR